MKKYEKLLVGGIWSIITLEYFYEEDQKGSPFMIRELKPIQMPNMDMDELFRGPAGIHRGPVDRRAAPFDRHGADAISSIG